MKRLLSCLIVSLSLLTVSAQAIGDGRPEAPQLPPHPAVQNQPGKATPQKQGLTKEERQKMFEEMKLRMVAFFTAEIGLTSEEADAFWPVYNDLRGRRWKINHELHKLYVKTDEAAQDYSKVLRRIRELQQKSADLDKETYEKLSAILSPEKMYRYYRAEDSWQRNLLRDMEAQPKK